MKAKASPTAPKPTCRVLIPPTRDAPGVVTITADGDTSLYFLCELPSATPKARQFELVGYRVKDAGTERAARRYAVLLFQPAEGEPADGVCDCPSGTYHRVACRHVLALSALWIREKI